HLGSTLSYGGASARLPVTIRGGAACTLPPYRMTVVLDAVKPQDGAVGLRAGAEQRFIVRDELTLAVRAGYHNDGPRGGAGDPAALQPGARGVVVAQFNTWPRPVALGPGAGGGARYALGPDYHRLSRKKLLRLLRAIQAMAPCQGRITVDAHPLLERAFARRA